MEKEIRMENENYGTIYYLSRFIKNDFHNEAIPMRYEGEIKNGKMDGWGIMYFKSGYRKEGIFYKGWDIDTEFFK